MNCQEFQEQLDAALDERSVISADGESSIDRDTVAHAESCSDCQLLYEEHVLIEAALASWIPRRPVIDVADRVIEAARQEGLITSNGADVASEVVSEFVSAEVLNSHLSPVVRPADTSEGSPRRSLWPTVTTVALVLIAIAIVFNDQPNQVAEIDSQDDQHIPRLIPTPQPEQLDEPQDQLADIGELVADARSAWQGILRRVSHQASGFRVFVPDFDDELGITKGIVPDEADDNAEPIEPSAMDKAFWFLFDDADTVSVQTI